MSHNTHTTDVHLRLTPSQAAKLTNRARRNNRTLQGEIRHLVDNADDGHGSR